MTETKEYASGGKCHNQRQARPSEVNLLQLCRALDRIRNSWNSGVCGWLLAMPSSEKY